MKFKKILPEVFESSDPVAVMGQAARSALGDSISVLVWNIYKARKSGWLGDFQRLIENRDLVLLQESVFNTRHDGIFEQDRSRQWIMARSHKYRRSLMVTGLKTGAVAAAEAPEFLHSPDREPFLKTAKLMLATKYRLADSGQSLLVVNVHAINFVPLRKYMRHIHQILPVIRTHAGPLIIAGDFNCWNATRENFLFSCMESEGMTPAVPARKTRWRHLNRHLDHIFFRDLTLVKAETLSAIASSDHYPIAAEFRMKISGEHG